MGRTPFTGILTLEFTVGDNRFRRRWEITGDAYDVTETGSFKTQVEIDVRGVYPLRPPCGVKSVFPMSSSNLTTVAGCVDEFVHTGVPYTKETNDYGSAMGSLVNKGLAMMAATGYTSPPKNWAIYDQFFGHEIAEMILTWQFGAELPLRRRPDRTRCNRRLLRRASWPDRRT